MVENLPGISKHLKLYQAHDVGGEKAASNTRNVAKVPVAKSVWGTLESDSNSATNFFLFNYISRTMVSCCLDFCETSCCFSRVTW